MADDLPVQNRNRSVSAIELLSIVGFAAYVGWMLTCFFWLFCEYPRTSTIAERDFTQWFVFLGMVVGFLGLALLGRNTRFNLFSVPIIAVETLFLLLLPILSLLLENNIPLPIALISALNFFGGLSGAALRLSWLDVGSRLRTDYYRRFTGLSFMGGILLFILVAIAPNSMQALFSFVYAGASIGLLLFATGEAEGNPERAPLDSYKNTWSFTKEIEPSFFVFGIVFALAFVFLFNSGETAVLIGLLAALPGALLVVLLSVSNVRVSITVYQRIWLVAAVFSCIIMPFVAYEFQMACACLLVACWAMFRCVNSAFIIRKAVTVRDTPLFRQAPLRLLVSSAGFAVGWLIAALVTVFAGAHSGAFTAVHLIMVIVLVLVMMVFFPVGAHHQADGTTEPAPEPTASTIVSVSLDEQDLFELRCAAVSKLYQLSPRESDILKYLARGRNAAYIQEELTISPHTVKSHIYNIYRKLDIHSQQKLMSLIEDYQLDESDLKR